MSKLITHSVFQDGKVDGKIIGVFLKDLGVQFTVRDYGGRTYKLMAYKNLAKHLLKHFNKGFLRLKTRGVWNRTDKKGWATDPNNCWIINFSKLEDIDAIDIFNQLKEIVKTKDYMKHWSELIQATIVPKKPARNQFHTEIKLKKYNEALSSFKELDYIEKITTFLNLDRLEIGQGFLNENGRSWCHFTSKFKNKKFSTFNYGRLIIRIK